MKKRGILFVVGLAVPFLFAVTEVAAQPVEYTCCEGGVRPWKKCEVDDDCGGVCTGGFRDGRPCARAGCPNACEGGFDAGKSCSADADCRYSCSGGDRDGKLCDPNATTGVGCPGGECSNAGTCSDLGECAYGTCTGTCEARSKSKKPDNPASTSNESQRTPAVDDLLDALLPPTCEPAGQAHSMIRMSPTSK